MLNCRNVVPHAGQRVIDGRILTIHRRHAPTSHVGLALCEKRKDQVSFVGHAVHGLAKRVEVVEQRRPGRSGVGLHLAA